MGGSDGATVRLARSGCWLHGAGWREVAEKSSRDWRGYRNGPTVFRALVRAAGETAPRTIAASHLARSSRISDRIGRLVGDDQTFDVLVWLGDVLLNPAFVPKYLTDSRIAGLIAEFNDE